MRVDFSFVLVKIVNVCFDGVVFTDNDTLTTKYGAIRRSLAFAREMLRDGEIWGKCLPLHEFSFKNEGSGKMEFITIHQDTRLTAMEIFLYSMCDMECKTLQETKQILKTYKENSRKITLRN